MKAMKVFLASAALMVLAFGMYVAAPLLRAKLQPASAPAPPVAVASGQFPAPAPRPIAPRAAHVAESAAVQPNPVAIKTAIAEPTPDEGSEPTADPQPDAPEVTPPPPQMRTLYGDSPTVSFKISVLPGQEVHFDNSLFSWIRIFSRFPFAFQAGQCQATSTTDVTCSVQPNASINLQDLRVGVPADSAEPNVLHITAMRDAP
jgi:hypothetical protein